MKLPEYTLKKSVTIADGLMSDVVEFPAGTLVFPFWNEEYVPPHRKKELEEARRFQYKDAARLIMCIIGTRWVPVEEDKIRKNQ